VDMREENLERAIGSVVIGIIAGGVVSYICAGYLTVYVLLSGRFKLVEYPVTVQPVRWRSWDTWTIAISLVAGVMTTIFLSRSLFRWGQAAAKSKSLGH
jgi:hypothetical protein